MKNLRLTILFCVIISTMLTAGCAGSSKFELMKPEEKSSLKGQKEVGIIERLGEPDRRYDDSNGNTIWEYSKPAASQGTVNKMITIGTMGFSNGKNSMYVDVLRLTFRKGAVQKYTYEESVVGLGLSGMMGAQVVQQYIPSGNGTKTESESEPERSQQKTTKVAAIEKETPNEQKPQASVSPQNTTTASSSMTVTGNKAKIRKKPTTKADIVKTIKKGEVVQVIKQSDDWFQVELASGDVGWCHKSVLERRN